MKTKAEPPGDEIKLLYVSNHVKMKDKKSLRSSSSPRPCYSDAKQLGWGCALIIQRLARMASALALTSAAATLNPAIVKAQDYTSGNYWIEQCESGPDREGTTACVVAVAATLRTIGVLQGLDLLKVKLMCPPSEITVGQARRIVTRHMRNNPEMLHMSFQSIIIAALIQAYPCSRR